VIRRRPRGDERGQGLVEFSLLVPAFLLLLLAMLEFGFVFDHLLTIQYATREGARTGAALAAGGSSLPCATGVDPLIIQAVNRVLQSNGSRVDVTEIQEIRIYKAGANGSQDLTSPNAFNIWNYSNATHTFTQTSVGWSACVRNNGVNPDSIGVSLVYRYRMQTSLGSVLRFFGGTGWSTITISDRTVMSLNPTD
jgi:Flp pilus assembly protein TadG